MTLKAQMAADVAAVFFNADEFADSATWRHSVNSARLACSVIVEEDPAGGLIDIGQARSATLRLQSSEIEDPCVGGIVEIDATGQQWQVDSVPVLEAGVWSMHAVTDRRPRA